MSALPTLLYQAAQVRELDRIAIEEYGMPGMKLMERAGLVAWERLRAHWPKARRITVICGGGNNGGDGYILARCALEEGCDVRLLYLHEPASLKGDAKDAAGELLAVNAQVEPFSPARLEGAEVIVDALLGTGLDREVSGRYREVIEAVNQTAAAVLAIDIPSGLNADSGRAMGIAVKADITVTFIGLKQGLFTGDGAHYCGKVLFSDLDVPGEIYTQQPAAATRVDLESLSSLLPRRARTAHKGDFGHVLVIGGDAGFLGAACMAGTAAARVGAGLVTVATRPEHAQVLALARPELMTRGISDPGAIKPLLGHATVVVIGPGLGQSDWAAALLAHVLESQLPTVVDADGLNLLAHEPICSDHWLLTPHPGEAARLLGMTSADIQGDRFAAARALQKKCGGVAILKGSGSLIVDADGSVAVCSGGNPGMASGGMGDILAGTLGGLLAQRLIHGFSPGAAARLAVSLHAAAADAAATEGERGMLASDLLPWLRRFANPE